VSTAEKKMLVTEGTSLQPYAPSFLPHHSLPNHSLPTAITTTMVVRGDRFVSRGQSVWNMVADVRILSLMMVVR